MSRFTSHGFTLIEVLVALAVIGIAFAALGFVQVTNLQATSSSRLVTETKAAANAVLEEVLAEVLLTGTCADPLATYCDEDGVYFAFNDFYWSCPSRIEPPAGALTIQSDRSALGQCSGSRTVAAAPNRTVAVAYSIAGEADVLGQGVLSVQVTATHPLGSRPSLTIGDRITCFDVYPTPTSEAPAPCPDPSTRGR